MGRANTSPLHFGAVKSAFFVWVNGQRIGYSQGSKLPAEFDITAALQNGDNTAGARSLPLERRQLLGVPRFLAALRHRTRMCGSKRALRCTSPMSMSNLALKEPLHRSVILSVALDVAHLGQRPV